MELVNVLMKNGEKYIKIDYIDAELLQEECIIKFEITKDVEEFLTRGRYYIVEGVTMFDVNVDNIYVKCNRDNEKNSVRFKFVFDDYFYGNGNKEGLKGTLLSL